MHRPARTPPSPPCRQHHLWYYGVAQADEVLATQNASAPVRSTSARTHLGTYADAYDRPACTCESTWSWSAQSGNALLVHNVSPWYGIGIPAPDHLLRLEGAQEPSKISASNCQAFPATHATRHEHLQWPESWARQLVVVYYGAPALQPQRRLLVSARKLTCYARRRHS
jgi:hypothetical protein